MVKRSAASAGGHSRRSPTERRRAPIPRTRAPCLTFLPQSAMASGDRPSRFAGRSPMFPGAVPPPERYDPDPPAHGVTCPVPDRQRIVANVLTDSDRRRTLAQRQQWRYSSAVKDIATQELGQELADQPD